MDGSFVLSAGQSFWERSWPQKSLLLQDGYLVTVKLAGGFVDTPYLKD
jgi:hypothetical protein